MKRIMLALLLCLTVLFATACDMLDQLESKATEVLEEISAKEASKQICEREVHGYSLNKKNDAVLLEVLAALDERDQDALVSLFIPYAMENVEQGNIEAGLEYLFSIYKGTMVEWYRLKQWGDGTIRNSNGWKYREDSIFEYLVTTDAGYYRVVLYRCLCQNSERDENGLYRLAMIPDQEDFDYEDYIVMTDRHVAGFYLPSGYPL